MQCLVEYIGLSTIMRLLHLDREFQLPTQRHWNDIKNIFQYLKRTIDLGLFFPYRETRGTADGTAIPKGNVDGENATHYTKKPNDVLVGFADAGYISDPHIAVFPLVNT